MNAPTRIGVRELRANLSGLLRKARNGESFIVMSRDVVVAQINPPTPDPAKRRVAGALKGQIWIADDFDSWPDDFLDAMEGN
ncbi:type II toxin-antitoxin system Phd/YefM family antitoxin [Sphingomonas sp.]|jgi:antitoxin (DNA-binding transcriptional repressor) of toxin-antitoxin stability system|uniref:type II toxin-antitoxin system Phd/YefM family antitoxin n=1 Tax=Sphingomonas sp. TaxID=28214 RepID=UPI003751ACE3